MGTKFSKYTFVILLIGISLIYSQDCEGSVVCSNPYCCVSKNLKCYNDLCCEKDDIEFEGGCYSNKEYKKVGTRIMKRRDYLLVVTILPISCFIILIIFIGYKIYKSKKKEKSNKF